MGNKKKIDLDFLGARVCAIVGLVITSTTVVLRDLIPDITLPFTMVVHLLGIIMVVVGTHHAAIRRAGKRPAATHLRSKPV